MAATRYSVVQPIEGSGPMRMRTARVISHHRTRAAAEATIRRATKRLRRMPGSASSWLDWHVRENPFRSRTPGRDQRGGIGTGTLLLLGAAAFVLLTPQGRALISGLGLGTSSSSIPSSLPVGTVRLANGQYQMPNGQIVGAPLSGQAPAAGSSITPIVGAVVQSLPSLVSLFRQLFPTTQGSSAQIPASSGSVAPVEIPIGTLTLSDGSVLEIGGATPWELTPWSLGTDLTLEGPSAGVDWWSGGGGSDQPVELEFTNTWTSELDPSGFSFDPDVSWAFDPSLDFGFGALPAAARVGYTPPAMRHG